MKLLKRLIAAAAALTICTAAPTYSIEAAPAGTARTYSSSYDDYYDNLDKELCAGYEMFSTPDEAAEYVRAQMVLRNPNISFILPINKTRYEAIYFEIMGKALEETGIPDEGDYIRHNISSNGYGVSYGYKYMKMTFKMTYRATAAQEAAVASAVTQTLSELGVSQMNDYNKIYTIYDYIASNVKYDYGEDRIKYSAYGAMINKSAACNGYSLLLYRMLTEAGISTRIVLGTTEGGLHAWNIALLDGKYYYLDSTWGTGYKSYDYPYFLKGSSDFDSYNTDIDPHVLSRGDPDSPTQNIDYTSEEFQTKYPIAETAYDVSNSKMLGDIDGDCKVTAYDASLVLHAYVNASIRGSHYLSALQALNADVNTDGRIDAVDAAYILQYYDLVSAGMNVEFSDIPLKR